MTDAPLLTAKEAAARLNMHVNSVKRLIRNGKLPYYKVSERGDIRLAVADVDAWLAGRRKEGTE